MNWERVALRAARFLNIDRFDIERNSWYKCIIVIFEICLLIRIYNLVVMWGGA